MKLFLIMVNILVLHMYIFYEENYFSVVIGHVTLPVTCTSVTKRLKNTECLNLIQW